MLPATPPATPPTAWRVDDVGCLCKFRLKSSWQWVADRNVVAAGCCYYRYRNPYTGSSLDFPAAIGCLCDILWIIDSRVGPLNTETLVTCRELEVLWDNPQTKAVPVDAGLNEAFLR
jgi:hypothetical protein